MSELTTDESGNKRQPSQRMYTFCPWFPVRINRSLIPLKLLFFFSIGGNGVINPFVPLYMKQMGLTSMETGVMYGAMPFLSIPVVPLIGALADKLGRPKLVLFLVCLLTGLSYGLLLTVPDKDPITHYWKLKYRHLEVCTFNVTHCSDLQQLNRTGVKNLRSSKQSLDCSIPVNLNPVTVHKMDSQLCVLRTKANYEQGHSATSVENATETNIEYKRYFDFEANGELMASSYSGINSTEKHNTLKDSSFNILTSYSCVFKCEDIATWEPKFSTFNKTFWISCLVWFLCNVFLGSVYPITNSLAYNMLDGTKGSYGRQRVWGTVGYALFGFLAGYVMDKISGDNLNFTASFTTFITFMVFASFFTSLLKINKSPGNENSVLSKNVFLLFKIPEFNVLMVLVVCFGIMHSMVETFLFWYLQDIGSGEVALGLCVAVKGFGEIILFTFSKNIHKKIGYRKSLYTVLLAYFVRLFCYSVIPNAWYALPVQLLHGLTFALMYSTVTSYGSDVAPKSLSTTIQGILGSLQLGLGGGIGNVVTGKLFQTNGGGVGPVWTFRIFSFVALGLLVLYIVLNHTIFRTATVQKPKSASMKRTEDVTENGEDLAEHSVPLKTRSDNETA